MKNIPILYDDEQMIIFNKPSGIVVTPSPGKKVSLTQVVNEQYPQEGVGLHPCHRLDHETSGVIMYAKGKKNQQMLMALFQHGKIEKTYVAFVKGRVKKSSGKIEGDIRDHHQKKFAGASRGKSAVTAYYVLCFSKGFTVVGVKPETGRTNQIRIHFAETGHPLLGERVYAFRRDFDVDMKRLALHAGSLEFFHPVTGKKTLVKSVLPADMKDFLEEFKINPENINQLI